MSVTVQVCLLSGRSVSLEAELSSSVGELKRRAQTALSTGAWAQLWAFRGQPCFCCIELVVHGLVSLGFCCSCSLTVAAQTNDVRSIDLVPRMIPTILHDPRDLTVSLGLQLYK